MQRAADNKYLRDVHEAIKNGTYRTPSGVILAPSSDVPKGGINSLVQGDVPSSDVPKGGINSLVQGDVPAKAVRVIPQVPLEDLASIEDSLSFKEAAENARAMRRGLNSAEVTKYLEDDAKFQKALQEARNRPIDPYTGKPITNGGIRSLGEFLPGASKLLNSPILKGTRAVLGKALGAAGVVGMGLTASDLTGNLPSMLSGRGGLESLPSPIRNILLTGSPIDPSLQKAGAYAAGLFAPDDKKPQAAPTDKKPQANPIVLPPRQDGMESLPSNSVVDPSLQPVYSPLGQSYPVYTPSGQSYLGRDQTSVATPQSRMLASPRQPSTTTVFPNRMTMSEIAAALNSGKMTEEDISHLQDAGLEITENPPAPAPETPPTPAKSLTDYQTEYAKLAGADSGISSLADSLKAAQGDISEDKRRAPWMALMKAGLATMAGKSPWAMVNIGEGAKEGVDEYSKMQHDIHAATAQQFALESQLAHAKRQEELAGLQYGIHSVEADKARQAAAEIAAQHNAMAMNIARTTDATHRYGYDQTYNAAGQHNATQMGIAQLQAETARDKQPYRYEQARQAGDVYKAELAHLDTLEKNFAEQGVIDAQRQRVQASRNAWEKLANIPVTETPQTDTTGFKVLGRE